MRWRKILLVLLFIILPFLAIADPGEPCGGDDPLDNECPLDSWVCMLVLAPVTITLVGVFLRSEAIKEDDKKKLEEKQTEDKEEQRKAA